MARWKWFARPDDTEPMDTAGRGTGYPHRAGAYPPDWAGPTVPLPVERPLLTRGQRARTSGLHHLARLRDLRSTGDPVIDAVLAYGQAEAAAAIAAAYGDAEQAREASRVSFALLGEIFRLCRGE